MFQAIERAMLPHVSSHRRFRAIMAPVCLLATATAEPHQLALQLFDQRGLPLHDAVVEIAAPAGDTRVPAFAPRYAMAQRNQTFVPGTLIVPIGATVAFPNLDTVRHSIYSFSRAARFQIDLYGTDQTRSRQFSMPGTVALGCHIHDRMKGYLRVTTTPYAALSDRNGLAQIENLPAGTYAATVWHPLGAGRDGEWHGTVRLADAGATRLTIATR
jgi:plastocyanin